MLGSTLGIEIGTERGEEPDVPGICVEEEIGAVFSVEALGLVGI